jgi:hypothetical protein
MILDSIGFIIIFVAVVLGFIWIIATFVGLTGAESPNKELCQYNGHAFANYFCRNCGKPTCAALQHGDWMNGSICKSCFYKLREEKGYS